MNAPTKTDKISDLILKLAKDKERKSFFRIFAEVGYLFFTYRTIPVHYFSRYLFRKDRTKLRDYIPNKQLHRIKPHFNDPEVAEVLENKLYFDFFYRQFNVPLPRILMYNYRKMFVVDNRSIEINNSTDFRLLLDDLIKNHTPDGSVFIKQTYGTYGGDKIYKITPEKLASNPDLAGELYAQVIKAGFLFQETVKQHPGLDKLNPSCLNTIRFDTFIDKDGHIDIISAYIRMSINNLHVDNIGSGGCCVAVDLLTGKLKKEGYLVFRKYGGALIYEHPITHTVFEGFSIPDFEAAKELLIRVASYMPGLRLIGWDVAFSESGPVLIEGNSDYDLTGNDLTEGGYLTNRVFRKVLAEINYKN